MHPRDQTIFALSSGRTPSAISIVRLSGAQAGATIAGPRDSFRWRGQGKCRRSLDPKLLQPNRSSQMFHCAHVGKRLLPY
jgi:hypothetical protein